jgi:hypothetical protein
MAKKDATMLAEKSSDHLMVRIRLVGHLDMMPESPTRTESAAPTCVHYVPKSTSGVSIADPLEGAT